ncbi:ATP-binding protein [Pectinatus haikarae]|uniref:ATP-binding protein n=1 Tax=Pectinatus haikarae TaxID=349096 RepID=A0ABT9Y3V3_9FIRM|nr:ATP-binding protein [Pectinatus haikarae]MDQ0202505.1 hypothetical protein [Pectinatus haikarae]
MQIIQGLVFKAQKIVIYGPEGIGKSTFASQFPDPLFIDTEGSTNLMDVKRVQKPSSWTMMLQQINEIKNTPGICKTLVIDTIDWAEQLCVNHVCDTKHVTGIEDFGYGKGYIFVKEEFGRLLNMLIDVTDAGINVVLTAHSTIRKFELPNECGSFDRYELKLGNKTGSQVSALVKEWADMVLFANYKQLVVEVNKKKKAQGGTRVIYTQHHPCWDAKNRHSLKEELPFEYLSIAHCIPNDDSMTKNEPKNMPESMPIKNNSLVIPIADHDMYMYHAESDSYWMIKKGEKFPTDQDAEMSAELDKVEWEKGKSGKEAAEKSAPVIPAGKPADDLTGVPPKLADLMRINQVTIDEIQQVVAEKGYYPRGTPIKNYDKDFIDGCLVGAWDQVFGMIEQSRIPF